MRLQIRLDEEEPKEVVLARSSGGATLWVDGRPHHVTMRRIGRGYEIALDDRIERVWVVVQHDVIHVHAFGRAWQLEVIDPVELALTSGESANVAVAPMPGSVQEVLVAPGDEVSEGQPMVVIESMKMQSQISAPRDGVVARVELELGETFGRGATLVSLEDEDGNGEEQE